MPLEGGALLEVTLKAMGKKFRGGVEAGFFDPTSATIAHHNEYGGPGEWEGHPTMTPPRPFMRRVAAENADDIGKAFVDGMVGKDLPVKKALGGAGKAIKTQILRNLNSPQSYVPNSGVTIRKKGFDAPLIETGQVLIPNVKYRVK